MNGFGMGGYGNMMNMMGGMGMGGMGMGGGMGMNGWNNSGKGKGAGKGKGISSGKAGGKGKGKDGGKSQLKSGHEHNAAKVFVGGLPKGADTDAVTAYFSNFGTVSSVEMKLDPNGMSRGFCFVTFEERDAALQTLDHYDQHEMAGKWIEVKSAMANGQPAPGQKGASKGLGTTTGTPGAKHESTKIFVGGLPAACGENDVMAYFSNFGAVTDVALKKDADGKSRGFGFVSFADEQTVVSVINNYNNNMINGKWVEVKLAEAQQPRATQAKGMDASWGMGGMGQWGSMNMMGGAGMGMGMGMGMRGMGAGRYNPY